MTATLTQPIAFSAEQQTQLQQVEKVANRLVELCRTGKFDQAIQELYADNAISVERQEMPGWPKEVTGKQAILDSSKKWSEANEVHAMTVGEPICSIGHFAVRATPAWLALSCVFMKSSTARLSESTFIIRCAI
jgi:hypothetical protein